MTYGEEMKECQRQRCVEGAEKLCEGHDAVESQNWQERKGSQTLLENIEILQFEK